MFAHTQTHTHKTSRKQDKGDYDWINLKGFKHLCPLLMRELFFSEEIQASYSYSPWLYKRYQEYVEVLYLQGFPGISDVLKRMSIRVIFPSKTFLC